MTTAAQIRLQAYTETVDQTPGLIGGNSSLQATAANVLADSLLHDAHQLAEQFRRFAAATLLAAVGAAVSAAAVAFLFRVEGEVARRTMGSPLGDVAPMADRTYHKNFGNPVRLLMVGDSIAAGLGASQPKYTLGARLAKGLARQSGRAVRLRTIAVVGSETSMLAGQLDTLGRGYHPDLAVIVVGGNDIIHRVGTAESVAHLKDTVHRLRAMGAEVIVGTCPDLGTLPAIPQPLRSFGGRASRRLAAAQAKGVLAAGGHPVLLGHLVRPLFLARPQEMFAEDRFHPSSLGYRRSAKALLPALLEALGAPDESDDPTSTVGPSASSTPVSPAAD